MSNIVAFWRKVFKSWTLLIDSVRTESQLEYIQRLTELAPEWKESDGVEVGERGWVSVSCPAREERLTRDQRTVWDQVREGDTAQLESLTPPLVSIRDDAGLTLLHWAADRGHLLTVKLLLEKDADLLDTRDGEGQTALHYAASCGHADIVQHLLELGADPSICDNDGITPCNEDTEQEIVKLFHKKTE